MNTKIANPIVFNSSIMDMFSIGMMNNGWLLNHDTINQSTEPNRTIYLKKQFRKNKKVDIYIYISDSGQIGFHASCPNTDGYDFSQDSFISCMPEEITSYVKAYNEIKEQFLVKVMKDYFYTFQWNLEEIIEVMNSIQGLLPNDIDNSTKVLLLSIINSSISNLQKYRESLINVKPVN